MINKKDVSESSSFINLNHYVLSAGWGRDGMMICHYQYGRDSSWRPTHLQKAQVFSRWWRQTCSTSWNNFTKKLTWNRMQTPIFFQWSKWNVIFLPRIHSTSEVSRHLSSHWCWRYIYLADVASHALSLFANTKLVLQNRMNSNQPTGGSNPKNHYSCRKHVWINRISTSAWLPITPIALKFCSKNRLVKQPRSRSCGNWLWKKFRKPWQFQPHRTQTSLTCPKKGQIPWKYRLVNGDSGNFFLTRVTSFKETKGWIVQSKRYQPPKSRVFLWWLMAHAKFCQGLHSWIFWP